MARLAKVRPSGHGMKKRARFAWTTAGSSSCGGRREPSEHCVSGGTIDPDHVRHASVRRKYLADIDSAALTLTVVVGVATVAALRPTAVSGRPQASQRTKPRSGKSGRFRCRGPETTTRPSSISLTG
jgi:hypothetical protein